MKSMLVVICTLIGAALADTAYLPPDADAEVIKSDPDTGFGSSEKLGVWLNEPGEEWRSFIRFDLGDISPGSDVDNCVLILSPSRDFSGGYLALYNVVDDWDEASITWNNQPGYDTDEILFFDWVEWESSLYIPLNLSIIQKWIDNPQDNEGLVLVADPSGFDDMLICWSRETDVTPDLWLSYEPAPVESLSWGSIKATEW